MKLPSRITSIKILLCVGALFALPAFYQSWAQIVEQGFYVWRSKRLLLLLSYLLNISGCIVFFVWTSKKKIPEISWAFEKNTFQKVIGILLFLISSILLPLLTFVDTHQFIARGFPLLWSAWWLAFLGALGLWIGFRTHISKGFVASLLFIGVIARIASWAPFVSAYPFSMGWSEASRYYYASLVFADKIYGVPLALSVWHPTRYLLQSIPFAFGELPLWFHRLWQVLLWVIISGISGFVLANRITKKKTLPYFLFASWFFLYLFQGAVYYHLQISIIIILVGVKRKYPWLSFFAILLASFWAGISRLNWYPVPAVSNYKNLRHYLKKPLLWTVAGLLAALASQSYYIFWSGNTENIISFSSSFTSDLLWYRLLPNNTYAPGIILPILLISSPLLGIIISALRNRKHHWHWIRLTGLWVMVLVLFIGGLIVSTKIGGGGDLHNMDAYLVLLGVWAGYMFMKRAASEKQEGAPGNTLNITWVLPAIIIPLWISLQAMHPVPNYDLIQAEKNLGRLRNSLKEVTEQGGKVLFITQRHLLAFDLRGEVPISEEYELIALMEMAMSENRAYLDAFHKDLREHRFDLIIAGPQFIGIKTERESFAEENNIWVTEVGRYLMCEYEIMENYKQIKVQILAPRKETHTCLFGE